MEKNTRIRKEENPVRWGRGLQMQYMEAKKQVIFTTEEILSSENIAIYIQEAKRGVNILGGRKI